MKTHGKIVLFIAILLILSTKHCEAQRSHVIRGPIPGEIYISSSWYTDGINTYLGIFHSTTNGEYLYPQYQNIQEPLNGEMEVGILHYDATPGVIYCYSDFGSHELWTSFDYGENWIYRATNPYTRYFSGILGGVITKSSNVGLQKSDDYGENFYIIEENANCIAEDEGYHIDEFYGIKREADPLDTLIHSYNYGINCSKIAIPVEVAGNTYGSRPGLSRGTVEGELYLISWWEDNQYKIFYSSDDGLNWSEQFVSETNPNGDWGVIGFTAGVEPCSFYVVRAKINEYTYDHLHLFIDYSNDCGQSYTIYHHELLPDFTGTDDNNIIPWKALLQNHPNPASNTTTIEYYLKQKASTTIEIYDCVGQKIKEHKETESQAGKNSIELNVTNLKTGVYFYKLLIDGVYSNKKQMLIVH